MILSSYERRDSPWVWVQCSRHPREKKIAIKTAIRKDDPDKGRRIKAELRRLKGRMLSDPVEFTEKEGSWRWVTGYLQTQYGEGSTLTTYLACWKSIAEFLGEFGIDSPAHLTREHCGSEYVPWRSEQKRVRSTQKISVNTCIGELRLLGQVMDEAIARGMADVNPARNLKIRRRPPKVKPEMNPEEIAAIYRALESEPEWMKTSFFLAMETGLRFSETRILRRQIQLEDGLLQIEEPKGGRDKAFSIPIYPSIAPTIRAFWESGREAIWAAPKGTLPGLEWTRFFRKLKMPHLCFHCTRVTFISLGARAGIPESAMMLLTNHSQVTVHRVYRRFRGADALHYREMMTVPGPPAAAAKEQSPHQKDAR